jgi:hypothetical protein
MAMITTRGGTPTEGGLMWDWVITVETRGIKSQVNDHTSMNSNEQETQVVFLAKKKRSFWITLPSLHKPMYMQN